MTLVAALVAVAATITTASVISLSSPGQPPRDASACMNARLTQLRKEYAQSQGGMVPPLALPATGLESTAGCDMETPLEYMPRDPRMAYGPPPPQAVFGFNSSFTSHAVLQQAPAKSAVYGTVAANNTSPKVTVTVNEVGGSSYTVTATVANGGWKAFLQPTKAGGNFSIFATDGTSTVNITDVTFGDVWYCGGQSNMALPMGHTFSRNYTAKNITMGKYNNIRLFGMAGNMNPAMPWTPALDAVNQTDISKSLLFQFSSTCWYYAEGLTNQLGDDAPPIGLIHTAWGGSMIEQWLPNSTLAQCKSASMTSANAEWWTTRILPFVDMTIKGWLWYQGENNMHEPFGAAIGGYGCMLPALIDLWRQTWSSEPGTTDPNAPFGIVFIPGSGSEGGPSMGYMRNSQTANYGIVPNAVMNNTFSAQIYDLDDPFDSLNCYHIGCCAFAPKPHPPGYCDECVPFCESWEGTPVYMGPIHPRSKYHVGMRLAQAAAVTVYGTSQGHSQGPTLAGCTSSADSIVIDFMSSSEIDTVAPIPEGGPRTMMQVLVNASEWCMQNLGSKCEDDGTGHNTSIVLPGRMSYDDPSIWVDVNFSYTSPTSVTVDTSTINGTAYGVRYGWYGSCCPPVVPQPNSPNAIPCPLESCQIMGAESGFVANGFQAKIVDGKCECIAPQQCSGS
eukprot:m.167831 g.167831  ORF g.167831 m.167831 type:complete len:674 (-) comp12884_c0_seq1:903-2924(-)